MPPSAAWQPAIICGASHKDWYAVDIAKLGPGAENDLIRYGRDLIVNTPQHLGKNAVNPAMRYAGDDLACQNCHLNAGLQPFAAPFISTLATFPMIVDDQVLTLTHRINRCMRRSMNGKDLPPESREMEALIAYFKFVGKGTPEGVRIAGMGLRPFASPTEPPDAARRHRLRQARASCHKEDGRGEPRIPQAIGYAIRRFGERRASMPPPAWPRRPMRPPWFATTSVRRRLLVPVLTVQQAWDVAAYIISKPHPAATPETASETGWRQRPRSLIGGGARSPLMHCRGYAEAVAARLPLVPSRGAASPTRRYAAR